MHPSETALAQWDEELNDEKKAVLRYGPIVREVLLALDRRETSFAGLETLAKSKGWGLSALVRAINILLTRPGIHICCRQPRAPSRFPPNVAIDAMAFNRNTTERKERHGRVRPFLASLVTGGGLFVGGAQGLLVREMMEQGRCGIDHAGISRLRAAREDQSQETRIEAEKQKDAQLEKVFRAVHQGLLPRLSALCGLEPG